MLSAVVCVVGCRQLLAWDAACCLLPAVCCRLFAAGPAFPFFLFFKDFVVLTSLMNFGGFLSK